ncbi:hypothetical protein D3C75_282160 [compost metagenome]
MRRRATYHYWNDPINKPQPKQTAEEILKTTLETIEKDGALASRGSAAWKNGIRAKVALDRAYGKDRKHG